MPRHVMPQAVYGPFIPNIPIKVPLWLALQLRKANKCKIHAPDWLEAGVVRRHPRLHAPDERFMAESLVKRFESEKRDEQVLGELPFHYQSVASSNLDR